MPPKCPHCGSADVTVNIARTLFCRGCLVSTGVCRKERRGQWTNPQRMMGHPLTEKYGYWIREGHPDHTRLWRYSLAERGVVQ